MILFMDYSIMYVGYNITLQSLKAVLVIQLVYNKFHIHKKETFLEE